MEEGNKGAGIQIIMIGLSLSWDEKNPSGNLLAFCRRADL